MPNLAFLANATAGVQASSNATSWHDIHIEVENTFVGILSALVFLCVHVVALSGMLIHACANILLHYPVHAILACAFACTVTFIAA